MSGQAADASLRFVPSCLPVAPEQNPNRQAPLRPDASASARAAARCIPVAVSLYLYSYTAKI